MKKNKYRIISISTWIILFILWWIVTEAGLIAPIKLPSPRQVFNVFIDILNNGYNYIPLWNHLAISMARLLVAIFFALITAVPLGLMCGYFPVVRAIFNPIINFIRPLPPLAYYTLLIVWLGIGEASKVTLLYIASFAPIFVSSISAVTRVNSNYILSAETFGATKWQVFRKVVLPASLPEVFVGLRTAVSVTYTTLVSAEMIAATAGIGWMVLDAYKYLKTEVVFVGIIIMGLTGLLLDFLLTKIESKYIFWNGK